jgi:hypothetical protein
MHVGGMAGETMQVSEEGKPFIPSQMGSVETVSSDMGNFIATAPAVHGQGVLGNFVDVATFRCTVCMSSNTSPDPASSTLQV